MTPIQTTTQIAATSGDHRSGAPQSPGEPIDYVAVAIVLGCLFVGFVVLNAVGRSRDAK